MKQIVKYLDKFLIDFFRPIVTFLDIEVLEIQRTIFEVYVLVHFNEGLSHLDDVVSLGIVKFIVDTTYSLVLSFR